MNKDTLVRNAFIAEGMRMIPQLEEYEINHLMKRFRFWKTQVLEADAFGKALADTPNLTQRCHAWAARK